MCDPDPVPCSSPSSSQKPGLSEPSFKDRKYPLDPEDANRLQSSQCHYRLTEFLNSHADQKEMKSRLIKGISEEQDSVFVEEDVVASCSTLDDRLEPRDLTRSCHASADLCLTSTARGDLTGTRTVHIEHDNIVYAVQVPPYTEQMGVKLHELMVALAGATPEDVLKLRTDGGRYVAPWLFHLVPRTTDQTPVQLVYAIKHVCEKSPRASQKDLELLELRLAEIAQRLTSSDCGTVTQVRSRVVDFLGQLDRPDLAEWLGECTIVKQSCSSTLEQCKPPIRSPYRRKTPQEISQVISKSNLIWEAEISAEVVQQLQLPSFDSWQWKPEEMLLLLQHMFLNLNLTTAFHIDITKLRRFLLRVYQNYNVVPFHNFRHGFCVAQMMFVMIWSCGLMERIDRIEVLTLMLACICHDLDHPGFNNIYQINAGTELALRYNDVSPLENHHCSVACTILQEVECDLLTSLSASDRRQVREGLIRCILATDMARHNEILAQFNEMLPNFSYQIPAHVNMLSMILIKIADVSNEARPLPIADHWIDRLLQEFYNQSDREREEGLPVTPFMDRSKVNKAVSQCNFISLVLIPLLTPAVKLLGELQGLLLAPVRQALRHYTRQAELSQTPGADHGASSRTSAALTRQMSSAEDFSEAQVSQRSARFRIATGNGSSHGDSFDAMEGSDSSSAMVQMASPGERGEVVGGHCQSKDVLFEIQAAPKDYCHHLRTFPIAEDDQPVCNDDHQQRPQFDKKPEEVYGGGVENPSMSTTPGRLSRYLRRIAGRAAEEVSDTCSSSAPSSPRRGGNSSSRSLQSLVSFLTPEQKRSRSVRSRRFNLNLGRRRPPEEATTAEASVGQTSAFGAQEVSNLYNGSTDEISRKEEDSVISNTSSPVKASTGLIVNPGDDIAMTVPTNGKSTDCTGEFRSQV